MPFSFKAAKTMGSTGGFRHRHQIGVYVLRYWFIVILVCTLLWPPGLGSRVAELHLRGETGRARADAPRDHRLGDAAALDGIDEVVLVHPADLAEQHQRLRAILFTCPR